jgi:hypothetical protein
MSESHRVLLRNHSGDDGDYALFVALPHITCEDGGFMQTNVWVSRYVSDGGEQSIEVDDDIYACKSSQVFVHLSRVLTSR